jgi:CRISPR/Cas system endoribonuclease Cas6 (RAMP superfamily)
MAIEELNYWCSELESLGLKVRLNEFNDKYEISNFVGIIKRRLYRRYKAIYNENP